MEIIKIGEGVETINCECKKCKSIFLYTEYDIKIKGYYDHIKSAYKDYEYVICPICHEVIVLKW